MHLHLGLKQEENIHGNAVNSAYQNLDQAANCTTLYKIIHANNCSTVSNRPKMFFVELPCMIRQF